MKISITSKQLTIYTILGIIVFMFITYIKRNIIFNFTSYSNQTNQAFMVYFTLGIVLFMGTWVYLAKKIK